MIRDREADQFRIALGAVLRANRVEWDYSAREIAKELGVTPTTYGLWERGERDVPLLMALRFCRSVALSIDTLDLAVTQQMREVVSA